MLTNNIKEKGCVQVTVPDYSPWWQGSLSSRNLKKLFILHPQSEVESSGLHLHASVWCRKYPQWASLPLGQHHGHVQCKPDLDCPSLRLPFQVILTGDKLILKTSCHTPSVVVGRPSTTDFHDSCTGLHPQQPWAWLLSSPLPPLLMLSW